MAMVQLYMYAILMRNRTLASDFSFMSFSFSSDFFIHEMRIEWKAKSFRRKVANRSPLYMDVLKIAKPLYYWKGNQILRTFSRNVGTH